MELAPMQDEIARLDELNSTHILDTPAEKDFDEAVQLAAAVCGTPIAAVNLLDKHRQWFKASVGLGAQELPREHAFCNYAIGRTSLFVIPDASEDERFAGNPLVTDNPNLRFYACMPLNTSGGFTLGTLCVADTVPHQLTTEQTEALAALGRQVAAQIELRAKVQRLAEVLQEKERMESELRERSLLFSAFMDHSPTIGFIKDREGRFLYYNRMFCERFAVSPAEWLGKSVFDIFPTEFATAYHRDDMAVLDTGISETVEETSPGPGGSTLYWRTHKFRISDCSDVNLLGGLCLDISSEYEAAERLRRSHAQLEAANHQLTELSVTDGLTGLRNRRAFDERLALEIADGVPLSLILLDVDRFKSLNDTHGHSAGDDVLRTVANLLCQHSRSSDDVARVGGEEFAVLLPRAESQQAMVIAERLRAAVEGFAWKLRPVTISVGVATRSSSLNSATELMEAADSALYRAKHRGRNRVQLASGSPTVLDHRAAMFCVSN